LVPTSWRDDQTARRGRRDPFGQRRSIQTRQHFDQRRRDHEQPGADGVVAGELLAHLGDAVAGQLHLGGVIDVEHARQIAIDAQHGAIAPARVRRDLTHQPGRRDLIRHQQQRAFGDERARREHRETVRSRPVGVVEERHAPLRRRRQHG
jgi:hypothetical protein